MPGPLPCPVALQLARLRDGLPSGTGWAFEPKYDGFRTALVHADDRIILQSRNARDLARHFPELVEASAALPHDCVIDGEVVAVVDRAFSFEALLGRLAGHRDGAVSFVAFDVLAVDGEDLRQQPFGERRRRLEELALKTPFATTIQTSDRSTANAWLTAGLDLGFEGVVAKRLSLPYRGGERSMVKVKSFDACDLVVGGYTGPPVEPTALLLGAYDSQGRLNFVGCTSWLSAARRTELKRVLPYLEAASSFTGRMPGPSRWESGRIEHWVPLQPGLVCEVAVSRVDWHQLRHAARLLRWRPDKPPTDCLLETVVPSGRRSA